MKKLFTVALLLTCYTSFSQAKISNDTLWYNQKHYAVGDTIQLFYGSGVNKKFVFVQKGSTMLGFEDLESKYSKSFIVIDKVYEQKKKYFIRGKLTAENIPGYKIFIDVEGAVDNKELN